MKKYLFITFFAFTFLFTLPFLTSNSVVHAQGATTVGAGATQPPDGTWLSDNDVTFAGKNAARAKDLFNWVLVNYQWSTNDSTLISFWATIRNVVFVFLILLVMVSAFLMIITGGQSLTAMQFIRKFLVVIILITFSFAIVRIFYQIVDVIQSFFIKNPDGDIISSKDLLNISFSYQDFIGYRRYGADYNESAFISLLLTKLTAATYFVMAGVLIIRKVILWFFITVSPIFPVLLLYFPVRNTAKIWIGEFFRWLLYAPLFAIFLSGLVVLWRQNINVLPFKFDAAGGTPTIVYPTAINILLGGPGQKLAIDNNINYPATFAEYIVALLMLWVVIFLPFLLLRIFLDYLASASVNNNAWQYIRNNANKILPSTDFFINNNQTPPPTPPPAPPTYRPTGVARQLPYPTGSARAIPIAQPIAAARAQTSNNTTVAANRTVSQTTQTFNTQNIKNVTQTPLYKSSQTSVATSQLVSFPIPTMRDVAKVESSRLSSSISSHQEISRVNETLQKIANPQSITNPIERQQFTTIKEKLAQAQKQGEPLANSILNAANNMTNRTTNMSQVTQQSTTQVKQALQNVSNASSITNVREREQVVSFKEKLTGMGQQGNSYATTIVNTITNISKQSSQETNTQVQQMIEKLSNPQSITNTTDRQQIMQIKEQLTQEKQAGNPIATSILSAVENVTNASATTQKSVSQVQQSLQTISSPASVINTTERQQATSLKETLTEMSHQGNTYVTNMLNTINNITKQSTKESSTQVQQMIEKLANPQAITNTTERQQVTQLKEQLTKEKAKGNPIATTILAATDKVANINQVAQGTLPTTNQVQTVNLEDYEEVKKTWTENYRNLEVPKSLDRADRSREEWVKEDLSKTTHAIDLLGSQDTQKVQEGMGEVSALLPFLLLGGFSQTEIVAYLQAKKHAAEDVLSETQQQSQEEDTLVDRRAQTRHAQTNLHMHASVSNTANDTNEETNIDEDNPLYQATHIANNNAQNTPQLKGMMSSQTMQLVNFSIPTMRDVATYEASKLNQQSTVRTQVNQTHEMLQKLANPERITNEKERETYKIMREQLVAAQAKGDPLASSILATTETMSNIQQLGTQTTTGEKTILQNKAKQKSAVNLPSTNQVQTVNLEDYEEVRKTWEENYKNLPVPKSLDKPEQSREEWIKDDITKTTDVINLLTSSDPEKKKEGMQLVSELLPFLLLGGFSEAEVISYLQAKKHAGEEVEKSLKENESEKETLVDANTKEKTAQKHMQEEVTVEEVAPQDQQGTTKGNE